ncbi:MAG: type IV secretion system DNA-binding domain-containing protein [Candidatus Jacksonbacteria bacterium]|nr:type IV secretion system DNA-binding domain-containing protein [Candidatus Jacksonbacteria bacterium]MBT6301362.1 type IV secretion system DNA-binding domain-containing protein [Candidatus Jacksonbacteria bacterium]MBT6756736.1 type IV secretion system DNA-binding domain-containing protein [Candidatus Jacksonbacteria bacterium]MBT6955271.1 type IV secretion system DNA-binding domain-containing protein [Candidatus Jacksonbacteria bacterium]MBT7008751.1 type IV secretion system DNA-binding dom
MEKPLNKPSDLVLFAQTNFRNRNVRFGIKTDDRRRHMYLIGKTGMGKSTVLENMIIADIMAGRGVCVVDPHGDLVEKVLDYIPSHRVNDTIYFNPADQDFPIAFNVLESVDDQQKHLVASGLIGVFKKIWADSWGPRLEYVLRNAVLALMDYPGSTLLGIMRMLTDKAYRKKVISHIDDPVVRAFWVEEYSKYPDKFQTEAIAPIQNKVGQFLSSSIIRNIVGQVKSTIDMRDIMDEKKVLLLNLSKGRVGEDNSSLLGAMMITKVQLAAMSRVDMPEEERKDFYLYVDEFQNFATDSFASILSEARKYRLNLIIAHQYIEQLSESVQAAVFGNVGTLTVFRVGATDADFLVKEFEPVFTEVDLVNLPKWSVYMKLMIDGVSSEPFSAATMPPLPVEETQQRDKIVAVSRERYAASRVEVEDRIMRWSGVLTEDGTERIDASAPGGGRMNANASRSEPPKEPKPKRDKSSDFPAECDACKKQTTVPFKPDPSRPVYCEECYPEYKNKKNEESEEKKDPPKEPEQSKPPESKQKHEPEPAQRSESIVLDTGPSVSLDSLKKSSSQGSSSSQQSSRGGRGRGRRNSSQQRPEKQQQDKNQPNV